MSLPRFMLSLLASLSLLFAASTASAQVTFTNTQCQNAAATQTTSATSGDFNLDGLPDLAFTDSGNGGQIFVCTNQGNNNWTATATIGAPGASLIRTGDVNGDGNLDLIVATGTQTAPTLSVFFGDGKGNFTLGQTLPTTHPIIDMEVGDLNGDHLADVVTAEQIYDPTIPRNFSDVHSYVSSGGILVHKQALISGAQPSFTPRLGDFNVDGNLDVAVNNPNPNQGGILIYYGNGDGTFGATSYVQNGTFVGTVTNVDSNPAPDLITIDPIFGCKGSNFCWNINVLVNDGHGNFTETQTINVDGATVVAGDLNGDGIMDLYVTGGDARSGTRRGVLLGNGDGTFQAEQFLPVETYAVDPQIRDLNLDGRHDVYEANYLFGNVLIYLNISANVICAPPGSDKLQAKFCSPANGASVPGSFTITGSGNSPAGLRRIEVWVDGAKQAESPNDQISYNANLSQGQHQISIVAVDLFGAYSTTNETVNVGAGGGCSTPAANQVNICSPQQGATVGTNFQFTAATNTTGFTDNRLYVDNQPVADRQTQQVSIPLNLNPGTHTLVLVSYNNQGQAFTASRNITVGGQGCAAPGANQVVICSPQNGSNQNSPVQFTGASNVSGFTLNRIYVDNVAVYQVASQQVSTQLNLSAGSHYIVLVSYNDQGQAFTASATINVGGGGGCATPAANQVNICTPNDGATVTSPMQFTATTNTTGFTLNRIYVDNQPVADITSQQVNTQLTLSPGAHYIVLVSYNNQGQAFTASRNVTAQ